MAHVRVVSGVPVTLQEDAAKLEGMVDGISNNVPIAWDAACNSCNSEGAPPVRKWKHMLVGIAIGFAIGLAVGIAAWFTVPLLMRSPQSPVVETSAVANVSTSQLTVTSSGQEGPDPLPFSARSTQSPAVETSAAEVLFISHATVTSTGQEGADPVPLSVWSPQSPAVETSVSKVSTSKPTVTSVSKVSTSKPTVTSVSKVSTSKPTVTTPLPAVQTESPSPTITSITGSVLASAGSTLAVRFHMVDPTRAGLVNGRIGGNSGWVTSWCGFVSDAVRITGNALEGEYEWTCLVPKSAVNGQYTLMLSIPNYNFPNYKNPQHTFQIVDGSSDSQAPQIEELSMPSSVRRGEHFNITFTASDQTEVAYAVAWIADNGGYSIRDRNMMPYAVDDGMKDIVRQGPATRPIITQDVVMAATAPAGTYKIWFSTGDTLGNKAQIFSLPRLKLDFQLLE